MITKLQLLELTKQNKAGIRWFSFLLFMLLFVPALAIGQQQAYALNQTGLDNYVPISWYNNEAYSSVYKEQIALNLRNATLAEALNEIRRQSNIRLTYDKNDLPEMRATYVMNNVTVIEAFDHLFSETGLEALASPSGQVVVKTKQQIENIELRQETITGVVRDSRTGETMPGVNVIIEGTQRGTSTNIDGEFELTVPSLDVTLRLSFIGYETLFVPLQGRSFLQLTLVPTALMGDELVVIGYGDTRRQDLTGSISSISAGALERTVSSTLDRALQGRAAGVMVTQNTGRPGGNSTIRIRGTNSLTGNAEPLYVVDGIPMQGNEGMMGGTNQNQSSGLAGINPNDIASIDILKDASATAIYGARASNGVVMITTKRGRAGETRVEYNGYVGFQNVASRIDMMNLQEYATFKNAQADMFLLERREEFADPSILGSGTNWQNELFRTTPITDHTLAISGGDAVNRYRLSIGYMGQDGVVPGSYFDRYSARISLDNNPRGWLQIGTTLNVSQTKESLIVDERQGEEIIISTALRMPPNVPLRNPDGSFGGPTGLDAAYQNDNPIAMAQLKDDDMTRRQVFGNVYTEVNLHETLRLRTELNLNYGNRVRNYFLPTWQMGDLSNDVARATRNRDSNFWWQSTTYLTYNQSLTDRWILNGTLGHEIEESSWEGMSGGRNSFPSNLVRELAAGDAATATVSSYSGGSSLQSLFARANVRYDERYLVTATMRADASSKFGPENRWGYFPSFSFAWRISNEQFFNFNSVSDLRLRAGYGVVGNEGIGTYLFGSALNIVPTRWGTGLITGNVPNPDLRWESTESINLGLDVGLFNDRINLTADIYQKWTDDLLMRRPLPLYSGTSGTGSMGAPMVNIGALENKGIELALNTVNLDRELRWQSTFIYTMNRNKVTRMDQEGTFLERRIQHFDPVSRTVIGQPVGQFFGYKTDGLFLTEEEIRNHAQQHDQINKYSGVWIGDLRFVDINGDGVIDERDRTVIGDPNPKFTFGISNDFYFRNFDVTVFINGSYGNDIFSQVRRWTEGDHFWRAHARTLNEYARIGIINNPTATPEEINNAGISEVYVMNPETDMPRIGGANNNARISDRFIEDGSYIRLRNLTVGYSLPPDLLNRFNIRTMRVYFSGQNLFTITGYSGHDPEVGSDTQDPLLFGVDIGNYPSQRIFTFGLNFGF
ncbi:MAG: TonB-dependent receptor [Balneolaceae bacterium]|nr:MAG: TonB-dependent receptor [Balneolaceae bacterium]